MNKETKSITKEQIQEEVIYVTGDKNIESKDNQIGYILLSSLKVGIDEKKIAKFLNLDEKFVIKVGKRLRKNGVWTKKKKVYCNWFDEETGGVAFILDILCGKGLLERGYKKQK